MRTSEHPALQRSREAAMGRDALAPIAPVIEQPPITDAEADETEAAPPSGTWQPIETAPQTGRDIVVRWGEDDAQGRVVRWHSGRRFTGRRWVSGGRWQPTDDMATPLPMEAPTHWYQPVEDIVETEVEAESEVA